MNGIKKPDKASFCRSINFYRHEATKVSKNISMVWSFFGSYFWRAPTHPLHPIGQKLICGSFQKPSFCSLKCFWAPTGARNVPPTPKWFPARSSYSIRRCPKNFWYQATPQGPPPQIKKSRFLAYRPNFDPQNPGVGGVGAPKFFCHKSTLYGCIISYNITLVT